MCSAIPRRIAVIGSIVSPARCGDRLGAAARRRRLRRRGCGSRSGRWRRAVLRGRRPAPAGAAGASGGGRSGGGSFAARAAARAPDSTNARMSFFVTRPPRPVPGTCAGSTPCSEAIRATTGETNVFSPFRRRRPEARGRAAAAGGCAARPAARPGARGAGSGRSAAGAGSVGARALRRRGSGAGGAGSAGAAAPRPRADHGELRPDVDRLALLHEDLLRRRPRRGSAPRCRPCRSRSRAAARRRRSARPPASATA